MESEGVSTLEIFKYNKVLSATENHKIKKHVSDYSVVNTVIIPVLFSLF